VTALFNFQAAVFHVRRLVHVNSGRIINVSSVRGLLVVPFCAAYTMTKHAAEAFSDTLRLEMHRFGVTVTTVEPGHFGGATESINVCGRE